MIEIVSAWEDHGDIYITFSLNEKEFIDVKKPFDCDDFFYIMQSYNSLEVYTQDCDVGIRNTTSAEQEIIFNIAKNFYEKVA